MSRALHATTPFPNHLLDEAMPYLKDTEWRLLCVIVRQTRGWQHKDARQRKTSDWLAQAQLVKKTGRDRAALSRALDFLVQHRYVEVRSESGKLLQSPAERRQCKSRLFYGLHPRWLVPSSARPQELKSEYQTATSNSLLKHDRAKSEYHRAPKANTTKETLTKENVTKEVHEKSLRDSAVEIFHGATGAAYQPETHQPEIQGSFPPSSHEYSDAAQDFIACFEKLRHQTKRQSPGISLLSGDAQRLEKLLLSHQSLNWDSVLQAFFSSDAGCVARRNHSLQAFLDSCHIFMIKTGAIGRGNGTKALANVLQGRRRRGAGDASAKAA